MEVMSENFLSVITARGINVPVWFRFPICRKKPEPLSGFPRDRNRTAAAINKIREAERASPWIAKRGTGPVSR